MHKALGLNSSNVLKILEWSPSIVWMCVSNTVENELSSVPAQDSYPLRILKCDFVLVGSLQTQSNIVTLD